MTQALIEPGRLPTRAMTDAETFLKKQTFKVEQASVRKLQALYRDAYRDLALALSASRTRADAEAQVAERLARLRRDILLIVGSAALAAWLGSYYGKLWLLDMTTRADLPVSIRVGTMPPDDLLRAQVNIEVDALTVDVRRLLIAGVATSLLQRLRRVLLKGNFNRVQVLARTGVQSAANTGALTALQANAAIVVGYQWLTAHDERVCPICAPKDGKRYPLNALERPPIHPQCRCSIVPILADGVQVDADARLREPFARWLLPMGLSLLVDAFLNP